MKLTPHTCPICGGLPVEIVDHVLVHSPIEPVDGAVDENREFDYVMGESQKVLWDTQELYHFQDDDNQVSVLCDEGHSWLASDSEKEDPPNGVPGSV